LNKFFRWGGTMSRCTDDGTCQPDLCSYAADGRSVRSDRHATNGHMQQPRTNSWSHDLPKP
jgi:hypothetical protein